MKNMLIVFGTIALLLAAVSSAALAEEESAGEDDDLSVFGLEVEKLLNLGSGLLAIALAALTFLSYHRRKNRRLLYVSAAFMVFAVKSLLVGAEIFFGEWPWVDPAASILDFLILVSFFFGIITK